MAPLNDVTNIQKPEEASSFPSSDHQPASVRKKERKLKLKQKKKSNNDESIEPNHTDYKQIETKPCECSQNKFTTKTSSVLNNEEPRVPPLPEPSEILLSQAVESLKLNPSLNNIVDSKKKVERQRRLSNNVFKTCDTSSISKTTSICNDCDNNEPSNDKLVPVTPQQCDACGLEFSSVAALANHLIQHVVDGLYAAQWLIELYRLMPNPNPINYAETNPASSNPVHESEISLASNVD